MITKIDNRAMKENCFWIVAFFLVILLAASCCEAAKSDKADKKGTDTVVALDENFGNGMIITVEPGTIKMPKGIDRMPVDRVRIRSTELRDLMKLYNAVVVEKVYKTVQIGNRPEEEVEVPDTYILWFDDDYIDLNAAQSDYSTVSVVRSSKKK